MGGKGRRKDGRRDFYGTWQCSVALCGDYTGMPFEINQ